MQLGDDTGTRFWFYIMGQDYLVEVGDGECLLAMGMWSNSLVNLGLRVSLGIPFLRAYYSIYDMKN